MPSSFKFQTNYIALLTGFSSKKIHIYLFYALMKFFFVSNVFSFFLRLIRHSSFFLFLVKCFFFKNIFPFAIKFVIPFIFSQSLIIVSSQSISHSYLSVRLSVTVMPLYLDHANHSLISHSGSVKVASSPYVAALSVTTHHFNIVLHVSLGNRSSLS